MLTIVPNGFLQKSLKSDTSSRYLSFEVMNILYSLIIQSFLYFSFTQAKDKRVLSGKPVTETDFG